MNRFSAPLLGALLLIGGANVSLAQQDATLRVDRKDSSPALPSSGIRELKDIPYVTGGHERQRLDLYLPSKGDGPRPLVIWIHGGGWEGGNKNGCPAKGMLLKGYAVASVGYRLSQHAIYPAQIEDCKAAVRWLRAHAAEYGIDPEEIGVWGASAGGHLAALLGTTGETRDFDVGENLDQSSKVQCVIDWFGPTDFLHFGDPPKPGLDAPDSVVSRLLGGTISENPDKARRASPLYFVKNTAAPFLIMQGDQDNLVPLQQSEILHAALQKAGVSSQLCVLPGAGHGGPAFGALEQLKLIAGFFEEHLGQSPAAAK